MTDAGRRTGTSQVYTWEPSNQAIAARYGVAPESVVRFDTNTSPSEPGWLAEVLPGPFDPTLNEYPDSEYASLASAAAAYVGADPSEILVGAGADEVLDIIAKTFLPPEGTAIVPIPTYGMYGVLTSQRPARVMVVPRLGPEAGFALDLPAMLARLSEAQLVWLTVPNNPTGRDEPEANVLAILDAAARLGAAGPYDRRRRGLPRVHRAHRRAPARPVSAAHRRAHRLQGLRLARHPHRLWGGDARDDRSPGALSAARLGFHHLRHHRRGRPTQARYRCRQRPWPGRGT